MLPIPPQPEYEPIVKVGCVLLRKVAGEYEVLIMQPRPKTEGYHTAMSLVRGTRRYRNDHGEWVDANRDGEAQPENVEWEPFARTLGAEVHEEAGLPPEYLAQQNVYEIGARQFKSQRRTHDQYTIHWFATVLDEQAQAVLPHLGKPVKTDGIEPGFLYDSLKSEWVTLARLRELTDIPYDAISKDRMHPEYISIVEEAIKGIEAGKLPMVGNSMAPPAKPSFGARVLKNNVPSGPSL